MIIIDKEMKKMITEDGEKKYPNECCGILYGVLNPDGSKEVRKIEQIENSFETGEQYHRFRIDEGAMMRAELFSRESGLDVIGFYHSHPDCPALPSDYDTSHALPVYSYIILSVIHSITADFRSYELRRAESDYHFEVEVVACQ